MTNLSSDVQIQVTGPGNYIPRKWTFFWKKNLVFFIPIIFEWSLFEQNKVVKNGAQ